MYSLIASFDRSIFSVKLYLDSHSITSNESDKNAFFKKYVFVINTNVQYRQFACT